MADLVVDLSSAPSVPGLCLDLVRYGGDVIWAGLKDREAVPVVTDNAVMRGITIHGGAGGTNKSLKEAVEMKKGVIFAALAPENIELVDGGRLVAIWWAFGGHWSFFHQLLELQEDASPQMELDKVLCQK